MNQPEIHEQQQLMHTEILLLQASGAPGCLEMLTAAGCT